MTGRDPLQRLRDRSNHWWDSPSPSGGQHKQAFLVISVGFQFRKKGSRCFAGLHRNRWEQWGLRPTPGQLTSWHTFSVFFGGLLQ